MEEQGYDSVAQLRGSASHATSADPSAFERANYMRTLHSWTAPMSARASERHAGAVVAGRVHRRVVPRGQDEGRGP